MMAHVLVVDDEEEIRTVLREVLEWAGHQVTEARTGAEGLQRYREAPVDVVITDILMPEISGLELIKALRESFPTAKIVAISGSGAQMLDMATQLGAHRVLAKPFKRQELLDAVHEVAESRAG